MEKLNSFETGSEKVPTLEGARSVLQELIGIGKAYTEVRQREDEKGLYLLEAVVPGESEGEFIKYFYMRKGEYPEGQTLATEIYVVYYKDEVLIGGTSAARYIDGKWIIL